MQGEEVPSGRDVRLTLDVQVQFMAEEALAEAVRDFGARWAGAVIVDMADGDILAWAQYPFFNPNASRNGTATLYRNRLALDALEPGSTLKPLLMEAALQEGVIDRDTVFDCENGIWKTGKTVIRDDGRS
jgi:cell division protein FtsI (penicillin-binding protein 3)